MFLKLTLKSFVLLLGSVQTIADIYTQQLHTPLLKCPSLSTVCSNVHQYSNEDSRDDNLSVTQICSCPGDHECPSSPGNDTILNDDRFWYGLCQPVSELTVCSKEDIASRTFYNSEKFGGLNYTEVHCNCDDADQKQSIKWKSETRTKTSFQDAGVERICLDGKNAVQKNQAEYRVIKDFGNFKQFNDIGNHLKNKHIPKQHISNFYKRDVTRSGRFYAPRFENNEEKHLKRSGHRNSFYKRAVGNSLGLFKPGDPVVFYNWARGLYDVSNFYKRTPELSGHDRQFAQYQMMSNPKDISDFYKRNLYEGAPQSVQFLHFNKRFPRSTSTDMFSFYKRTSKMSNFYKRTPFDERIITGDDLSSFYKRHRLTTGLRSFYKRSSGDKGLRNFYKKSTDDKSLSTFYKRSLSNPNWSSLYDRSIDNENQSGLRKKSFTNGDVFRFYKRFSDKEDLRKFYKKADKNELSNFYKKSTINGPVSSFYKRSENENENLFKRLAGNGDLSNFYKRSIQDIDLSNFYKRFFEDSSSFYKRSVGGMRGFHKRSVGDRNLNSFYKRSLEDKDMSSFYKRGLHDRDLSFYKRSLSDADLKSFYKRFVGGNDLGSFYKRSFGNNDLSSFYKRTFGNNDLSSFYKRTFGNNDLSSFYKRSVGDNNWSRSFGGKDINSFYKRSLRDKDLSNFYKRNMGESDLSSFYKRSVEDKYLSNFYKKSVEDKDLRRFYKRSGGDNDLNSFHKRSFEDNDQSRVYKKSEDKHLGDISEVSVGAIVSNAPLGKSHLVSMEGKEIHKESFGFQNPKRFYKRVNYNLSNLYKRNGMSKSYLKENDRKKMTE